MIYYKKEGIAFIRDAPEQLTPVILTVGPLENASQSGGTRRNIKKGGLFFTAENAGKPHAV